MPFLRLNSNHILPLLTETSKPPFPMASSPPSSSSSAEPHNHRPPSSSNSTRPLPSPPPKSPSPPSPIYSSQPLTKPSNTSPQIPPKIQEPQPIIYPVASSGRAGFIPKSFRPQSSDQLVTVANSSGGGFPPRPVRGYGVVPGDHQVHLMRPPLLHHSQYGPRPGGVSGGASPMKISSVAAQPKAAGALYPSSAPDFSGYRDPRDTNRDDKLVTVHDRKVRLSDGDSLYALCRSWVRNGLPKEPQLPQFSEGLRLLPKPTDIPMQERNGSGNEEEYKEEDVGSVEHLSARELLQLHVKRAKKIRSRLKKERLQRIERYKQRLSLLLPAPVEQIRNNTAES